jgi:hypothetical protein
MKKFEWRVRSASEATVGQFSEALQNILNTMEEDGFEVERIDRLPHELVSPSFEAIVIGRKPPGISGRQPFTTRAAFGSSSHRP